MMLNYYNRFKIQLLKYLNKDFRWLYNNKKERMDANIIDIFKVTRANFHKDRYYLACSYIEDFVVLDAACGTGYGSELLSIFGAKAVYGLDIDEKTIDYAKRKYGSNKISFEVGNIFNLPYRDNFFDVYISFETIEHVENEDAYLKEAFRVLKKGGKFIVSTPNDWGSDDTSPFHVRHYDFNSFSRTIEQYFNIIKIYNQNSGVMNRKHNHGQERGFYLTSKSNFKLAECFVAIAEK